MLADKNAAVADELESAFLLGGLIVPGAGEGDFHGDGGANALGAEIEAGVAGDNLSIGEGSDVAHLGLVGGDGSVLDHLVELHSGGDAGEVTALIDGSEGVVEVGKVGSVGLGAGGVAELDLGVILGGLDEVILMAEGVGEDDGAALVDKVLSGLLALLILGDVGAENVLYAELLAGLLGGVKEVEVVGGVLIVKEDEADLHLALGAVRACGKSADAHNEAENDSNYFLHFSFPPVRLLHSFLYGNGTVFPLPVF